MNEEDVKPSIVVGVRDGEHAALSYAVSRARQLGCEIRVVHAFYVPQSTMNSAYALDVAAGFEAGGNEVLAEARRYVQSLDPTVNVHYILTRGHASPVLLDGSSAGTCRHKFAASPNRLRWWSSGGHLRLEFRMCSTSTV